MRVFERGVKYSDSYRYLSAHLCVCAMFECVRQRILGVYVCMYVCE